MPDPLDSHGDVFMKDETTAASTVSGSYKYFQKLSLLPVLECCRLKGEVLTCDKPAKVW